MIHDMIHGWECHWIDWIDWIGKSGVPMYVPPAGQKSPKGNGFACMCLRRVKNPRKVMGSHECASGGSKIPSTHPHTTGGGVPWASIHGPNALH